MSKIKMECPVCGSDDVTKDAAAEWDTDAQAWARAVWTPCLPQPRPATSSGPAKPANRRASRGRRARSAPA